MRGWIVHILTFALAAALSAWFTPRVRAAAVRFGIVDRPDGRLKTHAEPVAYLGGLAIYLSFLVAIAFTLPFDREVLGLLRQLNAEDGTTIAVITHDRDLAASLPRQVHILDGRIEHDSGWFA